MNVYIYLSYIYIYPYVSPWCIPQLAHGFGSHMFLAALSGVCICLPRLTKAITGTVCLSGVAEPAGFHDAVHRFSGHQVAPQVDQLDVAVGQKCICIHIHIYIYNIYICMIYAAYLIQSYNIYI